MILALDTFYGKEKAKTVCLSFESWLQEDVCQYVSHNDPILSNYIPGAFYKRELPCMLNILREIKMTQVNTIIIDGFVYLDDSGKPGLGARLYDVFDQKIAIIGVAKNNFATIKLNKRLIFRGNSMRPLFITAAGMDLVEAAARIKAMKGNYRIPDLLKKLDNLTRT